MTSQRRILLCRLGFVLFCVVPTLAVGLWITIGRSAPSPIAPIRDSQPIRPDSVQEIASILSSATGLVVHIDRASGTSDALHLEGMRLLDPETGECVIQATGTDAIFKSGRWQVEVRHTVVNVSQARRLLPRLHDRLMCGPADRSQPIAITSASLLVAAGGCQQSFGPAQLSIDQRRHPQPSTGNLTLELSLVDGTPDRPLRLTASRMRDTAELHTHWQLTTSGETVPLSILAGVLPELSRLGADCHFTGVVEQSESDGILRLKLNGTLTQVDFDALVTEHFPHQLSGLGTIQIENAVLQNGRLVEFQGGADILGGSASPSLFDAAQQHLGLILATELPAREVASVAFQRLALQCELDGRQLRIRGTACNEDGQTVILGVAGPLLLALPDRALPAVSLLRALLPENQFQVPATRQTDSLVSLLPVPDIAPLRTAARQAHVPTRLRDSGPADSAPVLRQPGLR